MARPKSFDRDQALGRAMDLFWVKGYEATSLDELLGAMGIGRQSLYDTFGDKRALFLAALDRYRTLLDAYVASCLAEAGSVRSGLRRLFMQVVDEPEHHQRRGCLLVNSAVELAPHDTDAARIVATSQRALERVLQRALADARARGELPASVRPRALARFLVCALHGLRVAAKTNPDRAFLREVAGVALRTLG